MKKILSVILAVLLVLSLAVPAFAASKAPAEKKIPGASVSAKVDKLSGNQNKLWITVTDTSGGKTESYMIANNSDGTYKISTGAGEYQVYVDTKGNTQINACYFVAFTDGGGDTGGGDDGGDDGDDGGDTGGGDDDDDKTLYDLTIICGAGGVATMGSNGKYAANTVIDLGVLANDGYAFVGWQSSNGGLFGNSAYTETEFLMPANNTTITATFKLMVLDSDGDGLPDYLEAIIGSDPYNADTDGDGLPDGYEVYSTQTNPTLWDTEGDGVCDANRDTDYDKITNIDEYRLGTRPDLADTDGDGLTDYDEVYVYHTDPLLVDTDGDGLTDYEEILLGLDPNNPKSDGVTPDAERTFYQEYDSSLISGSLTSKDNWLVPSISGKVPGIINSHIGVVESAIDAFDDSRALVSSVIDIETDYSSALTLSFDCTASLNDYAGDIDSLVIFRFDGEELYIVDTVVDKASGKIRGEISGEGTYLVLDLNEFLKGIGIDVLGSVAESSAMAGPMAYMPPVAPVAAKAGFDAALFSSDYEPETIAIVNNAGVVIGEIDNPLYVDDNEAAFGGAGIISPVAAFDAGSSEGGFSLYAAPMAAAPAAAAVSTAAPAAGAMGRADIVFVIDKTGSMGSSIRNVQNNVNEFADRLVNEYNIDANFALVEFQDITWDGADSTKTHKSGISNWFTDVNKFKAEISSLVPDDGGDTPETPIDGLEMARRLDFRSNANKFVILITDAPYKVNNRYGITDMSAMTNLFIQDEIVVSVISYDKAVYGELFDRTDGLYGYIYGNFSDILLGLAAKIGDVTNSGEWILLDSYQAVKLSAPLTERKDTDGDGIVDRDELNRLYEKDMTTLIYLLMNIHSVPHDLYMGAKSISVWSYYSNPVLPDTDFDGIGDKSDTAKRDNSFNGRINAYADSDRGKVEFNVDYREFFKNNQEYNPNISILSSLYAMDIYGDDVGRTVDDVYLQITSGASRKGSGTVNLLGTFGMADTRTYNIASSDGIDTDDKTQFTIGHRLVEYKGIKKEIIAVVVRGTNGSIEEWSSNFDVGADSTDYYNAAGTSHPDWKNKANHKGFDVAANRAIAKIEAYLNEVSLEPGAEKVIWIMGHSRGAAVANIIGAHYENKAGFTSFTYAFATPNVTTDSHARDYRTIFNIVNSDDFVPQMPPVKWHFIKYGRTYSESIEKKYEDKHIHPFGGYCDGTFEALMGFDYNPYGSLNALVTALAAVADDRYELYTYTCSDHGNGVHDDITAKNLGMSKDSREKAIAKIPTRALKYAKITRHDGGLVSGWDFDICQTPAYFMQLAASATGLTNVNNNKSQDLSSIRFGVELNIASRYSKAHSELKKSQGVVLGFLPVGGITNFGGVAHPHYPESYYLLATKFTAADY